MARGRTKGKLVAFDSASLRGEVGLPIRRAAAIEAEARRDITSMVHACSYFFLQPTVWM
jgi:hypothetical protein